MGAPASVEIDKQVPALTREQRECAEQEPNGQEPLSSNKPRTLAHAVRTAKFPDSN